MNSQLGKILYEQNAHEKLRPASVTKIMTILLIMEALDNGSISLETKIPCSKEAASMGGSQIWLDTTENLTVDEMLKAICIVSANDCTYAMAEYLGGTEENFVKMMNDKAKELGMNDTNFVNSHGIDADNHLTSSYDIALMSKELLNNHKDILKYTTIWMDTLRDGKSELVNTNKLIRNYDGATGLKTGSTSLALYNLSGSATRDNLSLIAVVMRSKTGNDRFSDAKKLLDYGFSHYEFYLDSKKGDVIKSIPISKGDNNNIDIILENDGDLIIEKGQSKNIVKEINLPENISAPIEENQVVGSIKYSINNEVINEVNLIAKNSVTKLSMIKMIKKVLGLWFNLFR